MMNAKQLALAVGTGGLLLSPLALGTQHELGLVHPVSPIPGESIKVEFKRKDNTLIAHFEVKTAKINPKISESELYNGDVVELFLNTTALSGLRPYAEFEVSPHGQKLLVRITEVNGKPKFDEKLKLAGFKYSVTTQKQRPGWDATMEVPLQDLGWDGNPENLSGNAFAILGTKGERRYYSLNLPQQDKPSFHKPEFFRPFDIEVQN